MVAVVGLGLVGGSLARALTRAGYRVIGVDRAGPCRRARAARAVAATFSDVIEGGLCVPTWWSSPRLPPPTAGFSDDSDPSTGSS